MPRNIVLYGKVYTTSHLFIHTLRWLVTRHADEIRDWHFHLILDDRRDRDTAASLLTNNHVTVYAQYEACRPKDARLSWSSTQLQDWEHRYGTPHLRLYIAGERILEGRSEDTQWRYLFSHIEYFERLCHELQPALFISGPAALLPSWVAINVFRGNGIPCLIFSPARFEDRCFLPDDAHERLHVQPLYQEKLRDGLATPEREAAVALVQQYRRKAIKPAEFWIVKRTTRLRLIPRPRRLWQRLYHNYWTDGREYDEPFSAVVWRALKARRTWIYDAYLQFKVVRRVPADEPFFFYPLQFEPEMALSTQGRGWTNQLDLIRVISECLPIDRWLYVKEHPMMPSGVRPLGFYRELLRLPRVRLLDQRLDSYAVVPSAEAVITLGSTVGWEALMFGKPVLLAGRAFYEEFSDGVVRVEQLEELPGLLRSLRSRGVPEEALLAFIAAVLTKAPKALVVEPRFFPDLTNRVLSPDNLEAIARLILERLQQR